MIEYNLLFYDEDENLIFPSDLTLYNNISIICYIELKNKNKIIYSYAGIVNNKYYNCIEFINLNENINYGIIFYQKSKYIMKYYILPIFKDKIINYKNIYNIKDNIFNPLILNKKYEIEAQQMNYIKLNENLKLIHLHFLINVPILLYLGYYI
jgi:hypothetical protein